MPDPDYSLASKAYVPQGSSANPLETLQGLQRYYLLQQETKKAALEAQQKQVDVNSLADYKNTRNARSLEGATPELRTSTLTGDTHEMAIRKDTMARDAGM